MPDLVWAGSVPYAEQTEGMPHLILYACAVLSAVALGVAAYLTWQSSIAPAPYEVMFELRQPAGRFEAARRLVPLEGAANFRDLGGYATADGRCLAWGKVYRSDELCRLTDRDVAAIRERGIRLFCDLRGYPEVRQRPDRVPEGVTYRHVPVFASDPVASLREVLMRHELDAACKRHYRRAIIDKGAPALGTALKLAADPANLPLVLHCGGGKDRTGLAAALLLHICGVPRGTIVADYSLTNLAVEKVIESMREGAHASKLFPGLRIEQLYPLLSARPALIEYALAYIDRAYGSLDKYLRGPAALTDDDLDAIRRNLLA